MNPTGPALISDPPSSRGVPQPLGLARRQHTMQHERHSTSLRIETLRHCRCQKTIAVASDFGALLKSSVENSVSGGLQWLRIR
jgi:hypothetical protein